MLAGILLVFIGLILFRPLYFNASWSLDVKDWLHWAGITAATMILVSTVLALRQLRGKITTRWMDIHSLFSVIAAGLALIHSRTKANVILPVHYSSYLMLGLVILLAVSGVLIRLYPRSPQVQKYWRIYHLPLSTAFFVTLVYHVVVKLGVI
jgi:hypothetical protein